MTESSGDPSGAGLAIGLGAMCLLIALPLAGLGAYGVQRSTDMGHWEQTEGVVTGASISETNDLQNGGKKYTGFYYWEYDVAGTHYEGAFQAGGGDLMYQPGQAVDVFYDPDDPATSSLWRDSLFNAYMGFGLATLMVLVSGPFFWLGGRLRRPA